MKLHCVSVLLLSLLHLALAQDDPLVETDLGTAKGSILTTLNNREFKSFRGIRFAEAPVGERRFKAPVAVTTWGEGVLDATKDGHLCPQALDSEDAMSEDCLVINVYTRDLKGNASVMVYVHGGGNVYGTGSSEYEAGPQYFLDYDIVLVTMNYRLGALGFLSTGTDEAPGNYGYLDQVMALQWVHDHISKFGGNPESVTIFGVSAGAIAVTLHMASPLSQGLFHRVIAMSGSATNHFEAENVKWTTQLAKYTSCPMYNPKDIVDCLRTVPWETIIKVSDTWNPYGFPRMKWNYEVDGHFLLDTPSNLFAKGKFSKVPLMAGVTRDETIYAAHHLEGKEGLLNDFSVNFDKYAQEFFLNNHDDRAEEKTRRIQKFYLNDTKIQDQPLTNFGEIFSDSIINHGVHRLVQLARHHMDVYYYRLDYQGRYSNYNDAEGKPRGVTHGDDLQYIFKSIWFAGQIGLGDPEVFMLERICGWWTSFAQNGVPNDVSGVKWLPSNATKVYTMYNDEDIRLGDEPYLERYRLWDEMFPVRASSGGATKVTWMMVAGAVTLIVFAKNW